MLTRWWATILLAVRAAADGGVGGGHHEATVMVPGRDGLVPVPRLLYGLAWKGEDTARLASRATAAGFAGFDTANQPKHYNESGLGAALRGRGASAPPVFVQTKFTPKDGQDPKNIPYPQDAPIHEQVAASFNGSLLHLGLDWGEVDSLLLHSPRATPAETLEIWRAMERVYQDGGARLLGVSNFRLDQLRALMGKAVVQPRFVQNRVYAKKGWDREVREYCRENGIEYQGFSVITANRHVVNHAKTVALAERYGRTPQQIVLRFALHLGMIVLAGPKQDEHMVHDLELFGFALEQAEIDELDQWPSTFDESSPVAATFRNDLDLPLSIYWRSSNGELVLQGKLEGTGATIPVNTFHTHEFVVKQQQPEGDRIFKVWRADAAEGPTQTVVVDLKVEVTFHSPVDATVFWIGSQGKEVLQGVAAPTLQLTTYHGHRFVARTVEMPAKASTELTIDVAQGDSQTLDVDFPVNRDEM